MNQAKNYLTDTDKSMKEISMRVGYEDYSQFTKMFKKVTGKTPQEYRKERFHIIKVDENEERQDGADA